MQKETESHQLRKLLTQVIRLTLMLPLLIACGMLHPTPTSIPPTPTATGSAITLPVEVTKDVAYSTPLQPDVSEQRLDVYAPTEPGAWPVVVFLHGYHEEKEGHEKLSQAIAEQGAAVFTVDWFVWIPDLTVREKGKGFREMSETVTCATRFARATAPDYGGDPARVTLVGFSAGAAMGASVALAGDHHDRLWEEFTSNRGGPPPQVGCLVSGGSAHVDAFVGIAGPYSIRRSEAKDPELTAITDVYAHLGENPDLKVRLIHGEEDSTVQLEHSVQFNDALAEAGYDTELIPFDGGHYYPIQLTIRKVMEVAED